MTQAPSQPASNTPEFSVSEISTDLKRTVEQSFAHVRVRGEISGFKRAASGHLYMTLKDDKAVLDGVCWRGTAQKLSVAPEDGLEVIATGRLTTYPGRSKYQIVIDAMELAGEGALLKLLEERKRKLEAEGLFDPARKQALPFLPERIGVVTSPTGAVIRDILHRLADRFPSHVVIWPVLVQGDGAAEQVAAAIRGFNAMPGTERPDLLIVARGGGSLEDLWAFNEEAVVRAAGDSAIPLISAVGHETDVTLIDFAADQRAPTPTAAAEMAVPVRRDLLATALDLERRKIGAWSRLTDRAAIRLEGLGRGLPAPGTLLEAASQSLDDQVERLDNAMRMTLRQNTQTVGALGGRLRSPHQYLLVQQDRLNQFSGRAAASLSRRAASDYTAFQERKFDARLMSAYRRRLRESQTVLDQIERRLESVSHRNVLKRGFALIKDAEDALIAAGSGLKPGQDVTIQFADGERQARIADGTTTAAKSPSTVRGKKTGAAPKQKPPNPEQGQLL